MNWLLAAALVLAAFGAVAPRMRPRYRRVAAVALLGHLAVAVLLLPLVPYSWDISKFHEAAAAILAGQESPFATTVTSFGTFQALVYAVVGQDTTALAVVNGFLAVLIPAPLRDLARHLYPDVREADGLLLVILFMPFPFLFLTIPMRDALTILLFATIAALLVRGFVYRSPWPPIVAGPAWGALYLLRPELALVLLLGAVTASMIVLLDRATSGPVRIRWLVASLVPVGVLGIALFAERFPLGRLNGELAYRASGSAVYLDSFEYASWFDVFLSAPGRAIYFLYAPFPLHVQEPFHVLGGLSLPLLIVLTLAALSAVTNDPTDRIPLVFVLVVFGAGVVGYGLVDSNFGTTVRHRIPFVFLLVVLAAPVLERWWRHGRRAYHAPDEPGDDEE